MDGETTGIIISAGTVSSICTLIGLWIKAKFGQKVKVTRPVDSGYVYVTRCECEQHRLAIAKRIGVRALPFFPTLRLQGLPRQPRPRDLRFL